MLGVFSLSDHLLSRYSNQASEASILMNRTLLDVMELVVIVQGLSQDLVPGVVVLTLVIEVVVLMVLMYQSQIRLAQKVLVVQKVRLVFLEASGVSED